jgi:hypothetical protein
MKIMFRTGAQDAIGFLLIVSSRQECEGGGERWKIGAQEQLSE